LARARIFIESKNLFLFIYFVAYEEGKVPNSRKTFHNPAERDESARKFFLNLHLFHWKSLKNLGWKSISNCFFVFLVSRAAHPQTHNSWFLGCCCRLLL
jgi:hypothetical protein